MRMTLLKFEKKCEIQVAARYRRMLSLLASGFSVNESAEQSGIAHVGWNYAEHVLLKHPEIRQRLAAYALELVGGDSGF